jgi:hypothetical protein
MIIFFFVYGSLSPLSALSGCFHCTTDYCTDNLNMLLHCCLPSNDPERPCSIHAEFFEMEIKKHFFFCY